MCLLLYVEMYSVGFSAYFTLLWKKLHPSSYKTCQSVCTTAAKLLRHSKKKKKKTCSMNIKVCSFGESCCITFFITSCMSTFWAPHARIQVRIMCFCPHWENVFSHIACGIYGSHHVVLQYWPPKMIKYHAAVIIIVYKGNKIQIKSSPH